MAKLTYLPSLKQTNFKLTAVGSSTGEIYIDDKLKSEMDKFSSAVNKISEYFKTLSTNLNNNLKKNSSSYEKADYNTLLKCCTKLNDRADYSKKRGQVLLQYYNRDVEAIRKAKEKAAWIAFAKSILNDPNATPEQKAAAQDILDAYS